jgi:hypothetical protein
MPAPRGQLLASAALAKLSTAIGVDRLECEQVPGNSRPFLYGKDVNDFPL